MRGTNAYQAFSEENLVEASKFLHTDVKYKSKHVEPAPVIINMKGQSITDIFKWCPEEQGAFKTRAVFSKILILVKHWVKRTNFAFLRNSRHEFVHFDQWVNTDLADDMKNLTYVTWNDH